MAVGIPANNKHVGQLLTGDAEWKDVVVVNKEQENPLGILPASLELIRSEAILSADADFFALRNLIEEEFEKDEENFYDYILIDCPPSLGIMTRNALCAAQHYIVPLQGENFAFHGLAQIIKQAARIKKDFNPNLELLGILKNRFGDRTHYGKEIYNELKNSGLPVFNSSIRQSIGLMESAAVHNSIFDYEPDSNGAKDFEILVNEVVERLDAKE